jgi:hypothetical protein
MRLVEERGGARRPAGLAGYRAHAPERLVPDHGVGAEIDDGLERDREAQAGRIEERVEHAAILPTRRVTKVPVT